MRQCSTRGNVRNAPMDGGTLAKHYILAQGYYQNNLMQFGSICVHTYAHMASEYEDCGKKCKHEITANLSPKKKC